MIRELLESIIEGKNYNEKFVLTFGKIIKEKLEDFKANVSIEELTDRSKALNPGYKRKGNSSGDEQSIPRGPAKSTSTNLDIGNPHHDNIAKIHGYTSGDASKGEDIKKYYALSDKHAQAWKLNSSLNYDNLNTISEDGFRYVTVRLPSGKLVLRKRRIYTEDQINDEDEFLIEDETIEETAKFTDISVSNLDKKYTIYGHKSDGSKQKIMSVFGKSDHSDADTAKAAHTMAKSVAKVHGIQYKHK